MQGKAKGSGKLKRAGDKGQVPARCLEAPSYQISRLHRNCDSLTLPGKVNGERCSLLLDTGAAVSVASRRLVKLPLQESLASLKTANGNSITVYGRVSLEIELGSWKAHREVLVADILDDFIVGLDLMKQLGMIVDLRKKTVRLGNVDIVPGANREPSFRLNAVKVGKKRRLSEAEVADAVWKDMRYSIGKCLVPSERRRAEEFIRKESGAFVCDGITGQTDLVKHSINTGNCTPIKQKPRRVPLAKREEVQKLIDEMLLEGVIEESCSPWSSPVVIVKKKDGSSRFCVDYRKLNAATKKDSYPLPSINDTLATLAGSQWFSSLDLKSGYWQVKMAEADKEKTAFSTGFKLYQFRVMPFGLCNAPATFERLMETVLRDLIGKTCFIYLDDILVVGKDWADHLKNLKEVLKRLRDANLKLNPKKCRMFQKKLSFLGHTISPEGIHTDSKKISVIKKWPVPDNASQLLSFLGLCSYYRRFVKGFADVAKPLHRLTQKNVKFSWSEECEQAFLKLKEALCSSPILGYPQEEGLFVVDTDASNIGLGAVLSQVHDGKEVAIEYFSQVLSAPERNYCATRKELLAIVKALGHFHQYLYGRSFKVRSDHAALKWILNLKAPEGQLARWLEKLQQYDFTVEHRPGKLHGNADGLSRRPCGGSCSYCEKVDTKEVRRTSVQIEDWTTDDLRRDQLDDVVIGPILKLLESRSDRPTWEEVSALGPDSKTLWAQWNSLRLENGLLKRAWESPDGKQIRMQLLVPKKRVKMLLTEMHGGISGGHLGINKTIEKVRHRFYWPQCRQDVEEFCRTCDDCGATKGPQTRSKGPMRQYIVGAPFERIAIDIAGPFPVSEDGNKYILVAMDYFSKWPEAYAIPNMEAKTVARVIVDQWVSRFGVPLQLHSDQGRNFESAVFKDVCEILGIDKTRTTPLHPQSDGMVERFNRTMEEHLSKVVSSHQRDWDRLLPVFLLAYRSAPHDSTSHSPSRIVFGRELRLPCDLLLGSTPDEDRRSSLHSGTYVDELRRTLSEVHASVRDKIAFSSDRMKMHYDIKANSGGFSEGDQVWLFNPKRRRGYCPKLQPDWEGPFVVVTRINDLVYRIQKPGSRKPKIVHLHRLAKYHQRAERDVQDQRGDSATGTF